MLGEAGFEAVECADGNHLCAEIARGAAAAVVAEEALEPDAILMDVDMPTMNGIEATRRIKSRHPGVVIVGLSLHEDQGVVRAMREAGADAYVSKQAAGKDVIEAVRRACRRQEAEAC